MEFSTQEYWSGVPCPSPIHVLRMRESVTPGRPPFIPDSSIQPPAQQCYLKVSQTELLVFSQTYSSSLTYFSRWKSRSFHCSGYNRRVVLELFRPSAKPVGQPLNPSRSHLNPILVPATLHLPGDLPVGVPKFPPFLQAAPLQMGVRVDRFPAEISQGFLTSLHMKSCVAHPLLSTGYFFILSTSSYLPCDVSVSLSRTSINKPPHPGHHLFHK